MKKIKLLATAAILSVTLGAGAVPISGGISFAGFYQTDTGSLGSANALSFSSVQVEDVAGSYESAGLLLNKSGSINMNGFAFKPSFTAVLPLWNTVTPFTDATGTYAQPLASFDLLTLEVSLQRPNVLVLEGTGILRLAGFDETPGSWTFTAQSDGGTFSFSSSNGTVPDGGVTAMLLGSALAAVAFIRRKMA